MGRSSHFFSFFFFLFRADTSASTAQASAPTSVVSAAQLTWDERNVAGAASAEGARLHQFFFIFFIKIRGGDKKRELG